MLFGDKHILIVPAAPFEVYTTYESAILGLVYLKAAIRCCVHAENLSFVVRWVLLVDEGELKLKRINLDLIFPSIVLQDGRQEALSEEEA